MDENRRDTFWSVLTSRRTGRGLWERAQIACDMASEILPFTSFCLSLHLPRGPQDIVAATGPWPVWLDELQYVLGEGPAATAFAAREPVLVEDLNTAWSRWPAFCATAGSHGVEAVFALPVTNAHSPPSAVLTGYHGRPTSLSSSQLSDALLLSELVAKAIADDRGGIPAAARSVSEGSLGQYVAVVAAAAAFAVAHDITYEDALALVRAYAFAHDVSVVAVADALLNNELQLDAPTG